MIALDVVSRNGTLLPLSEARLPLFSPAVLHAFGVYESVQVIDGTPFHLEAHLHRLERSAGTIGLPLPASLATIKGWAVDLLRFRPHGAGLLRIVVTSASDVHAGSCWLRLGKSMQFPPRYWTLGADAVTFPGMRPLPQAKTLNTLTNYLAQRAAHEAGCHEGLLVYDGKVWEGSSSNLFVVLDGVLLTPPATEVLSGETRECVLRLAGEMGLPLQEAPLLLADLPRWKEAFLTSTSRHVMPLTVVDHKPVGNGQVGPLTRRLHAAFEAYFQHEMDRERSALA